MSGERVVVNYEELGRMSAVWREAAAAIARIGSRVAQTAASPEFAADAIFDPAGAVRAERGIVEVAAGPHGLAVLAACLAADSIALSAVVAKEQLVDDLPARQLASVARWLVALPIGFALHPRTELALGEQRVEALADALLGYTSPFAETLMRELAPSARFRLDVAERRPVSADPLLGLAIGPLLIADESHVGVVTASTYMPDWATAPPTMSGALRQIGDLERQPAASLAIQRIVDDDGSARYVVLLPGMRDFINAPDPQNLIGAAAAVFGGSTTYTRCVSEALDAAGVPNGAQVMLVGHSEGGIVAMDLAGDPAFNGGRVHVDQVVAAGSPISSKAVVAGSGTRVFSVENANDIVTHLDAVSSPTDHQTPDDLTYRFAADEHDVVRNHDVDLYAAAVADLASSPNPLLADVQAHLRPYFAGETTTTVFTLADGPRS